MSGGPLPVVSLDNTLGAGFLGNVAAAALFGVTSVQTYLYFCNNADGRLLRGLIATTWIAAAAHVAFVTVYMYDSLISNFGNVFESLQTHAWPATAHIVSTGVSDVVVRGIFIYRVSLLTRLWWLTGLLSILATITFLCSVVFASETYHANANEASALKQYSWIMDLAYSCSVVADAILTVALCISLALHRRRSLRRTERVVTVLMMYAINTGALVGFCTLAELICYAVMPDNLIFEGIYFTLPGLYVNALLATLNARPGLREQTGQDLVSIPLKVTTTTVRSTETSEPDVFQMNSRPRYDGRAPFQIDDKQVDLERGGDLKRSSSGE